MPSYRPLLSELTPDQLLNRAEEYWAVTATTSNGVSRDALGRNRLDIGVHGRGAKADGGTRAGLSVSAMVVVRFYCLNAENHIVYGDSLEAVDARNFLAALHLALPCRLA